MGGETGRIVWPGGHGKHAWRPSCYAVALPTPSSGIAGPGCERFPVRHSFSRQQIPSLRRDRHTPSGELGLHTGTVLEHIKLDFIGADWRPVDPHVADASGFLGGQPLAIGGEVAYPPRGAWRDGSGI